MNIRAKAGRVLLARSGLLTFRPIIALATEPFRQFGTG